MGFAAPRLAAFPLKCFTWLLETGVTSSIILPKLKKDNLITKVIAQQTQALALYAVRIFLSEMPLDMVPTVLVAKKI